MLFSIVTDPAISANDMNHDLDIIHQWKMQFNPDRNKQATKVSSKKSSPNHPQLIFNGTAVTKVNEQKHLGLILDSTLSFDEHKHLGLILESTLSFEKHLNEKIMKAKKMLEYSTIFSNPQKHINTCVGILKHLSNFLPLKTLDQMYKTLVRSDLNYCGIIYHKPSYQNQPPIGVTVNLQIQYQAALAISGAWLGSSRS